MKFCNECVMPSTRPDLSFDEAGVCDACRSSQKKNEIDWDSRRQDFEKIIKTRNIDETKYDCLIPVSGGKDSHLSLYYAKVVYGLNPLCICFEPTLPTEIGRKNLQNISSLGVDLIHVKQNPIVYNKLILEGLKRVGDNEWANHMGIWSVPVHFAINFNIPYILWGESPQMEYGGSETVSEINKVEFDEAWLNDYGCLNGLRPQDMVDEENGISLSDLKLYIYPSLEDVAKWGGKGLFMGHYFKWNIPENLDLIEEIGWKRRLGRSEVTYTDTEKQDCYSMPIHDYIKFLKFGYGRATDSACIAIRNGEISREEGLRLVEKYDGRYPKESVERFCKYFDLSINEFDEILSSFTNKTLFVRNNGKLVRDADHSLVMKEKYLVKRKNPK